MARPIHVEEHHTIEVEWRKEFGHVTHEVTRPSYG